MHQWNFESSGLHPNGVISLYEKHITQVESVKDFPNCASRAANGHRPTHSLGFLGKQKKHTYSMTVDVINLRKMHLYGHKIPGFYCLPNDLRKDMQGVLSKLPVQIDTQYVAAL